MESLLKNEFKSGVIDSIPIILGYVSMAITFGFMASNMGLSLFAAMFMSILMYAGSSQFMILSLLAAGSGLWEMVFTTFLINFRFLLIGTSFLNKFEDKMGYSKLFIGQTLTDETFTISSFREKKLTTSYILGLNTSSYLSWVLGTYIGVTFGSIIPSILSQGMGIALYAMFISILVPQCKLSKLVSLVVALTIVLSIVITYTNVFSKGIGIIISIIIPAVIGTIIKRKFSKR